MRSAALCLFSILVVAPGCRERPSSPQAEQGAAALGSASPTPAGRAAQKYGAPLSSGTAAPLEKVLERPAEFQGKRVLVEGHVRRACSRKGCWMELSASPDAASAACRVTFKDYGFFVPLDSEGASARVEASVELATLRSAHVEHLEQEGASFEGKREDGSAQEVRLVATGVELWR